ncbi:MAG: dipeptide epimerase, partial [Verrucomicrobia bacterium]|nr:dipeptide epimerase [Verrucomicrobiota bacterium]
MQLRLRLIDLPLRHAFTISVGSITVQQNLLVELRDGGFTGYGEPAVAEFHEQVLLNRDGANG